MAGNKDEQRGDGEGCEEIKVKEREIKERWSDGRA